MSVVYTIGYSGRKIDEFLRILESKGVEAVVDVRRYPRSKSRGFSADDLRQALRERGIEYLWLGSLGALGSRGYRAKCVGSRTFDTYVWRLVHEADAILQLRELAELARRRRAVVMCREVSWRSCHRQFIADALTNLGFRVVHLTKIGEELHTPTSCSTYLSRTPPLELIERARSDFAEACREASAVYLFGGALDNGGEDVDVVVYGGGPLPTGYDAQRARLEPTLFHLYVTKTGVLLCGRALLLSEDEVLKREIGRVEAWKHAFASSDDPILVCKSLKEALFLAASLICGVEESATWKRMVNCMSKHGIDVPIQFKHCLTPPPIEELRRLGSPLLPKVIELIESKSR